MNSPKLKRSLVFGWRNLVDRNYTSAYNFPNNIITPTTENARHIKNHIISDGGFWHLINFSFKNVGYHTLPVCPDFTPRSPPVRAKYYILNDWEHGIFPTVHIILLSNIQNTQLKLKIEASKRKFPLLNLTTNYDWENFTHN